uniref:Uncharacterized protein n=1 Tax=Wuchereria bancrofti TaxID=6293 RepID=A0A1I8EBD0_WUCBA
MLLTSQAPVAEPALFVWPHIIIAVIIFSVSTMVSLLTLCVSTHCCRNTKNLYWNFRKENPYGEIATTPTADVAVSAIVCRNRTDGSQRHHPSRLSCPSLASYERSVHRLSAPLPHSSAAMKRALPKLPELSARLENKNASALYSTIGHSMPAVGRSSSFLHGGETIYDVGYSHVRESMNMEPSRYLANAQAQNRNFDHLYSRIRRGPSMYRVTNSSTYRPLPSNDFAVEYVSSESDKTSREPSYRYITVRESVDAIRQRLNEFNASSNTPRSVINDGCGPIREHYYSSIGGSDYETLQISAASPNQPSSDNQDVPSTSYVIHDTQPETISDAISTCENAPPKPPTSPIPLRIAAVREDNLQKKRPLLSGTNDDRCSNISEKIRRLRTNFFDQEFKLLNDLKGPSSTDLRFEQLLRTTNQHGTSKWINSFQNNPNFDSDHHVGQASSSNFDDTYQHLPKLIAGRSQIHNARNDMRNTHLSTVEQCKTIVQNARSHSFNEADVPGIKQSVKVVTFQQEGNNDEEQCFVPKRCDRLSEQTTNNTNSVCLAETSLNKASSDTGENMETQFCSQQQSVMKLCGENDSGSGRSVQTTSFSHESINGNGWL